MTELKKWQDLANEATEDAGYWKSQSKSLLGALELAARIIEGNLSQTDEMASIYQAIKKAKGIE